MEEPQEVADEEYERIWERVAAVDVAKASGVVCTRVPDEDRPGRRRTHVWTVQATSNAVTELGDHLRARQIQVVTLESTVDYWRIWYVILEAAGLRVQLVNARAVKNVPGRAKTDKKDAVWLAKLTERGMLQPSFVPPYEIRRLREFTRLRADLVHERDPVLGTAGKATRARADQDLRGRLHPGHRLRPGDDRGADRRPARPARSSRTWPSARMRAKRAELDRGPGRPVRRPPQRAGPDPAGPTSTP